MSGAGGVRAEKGGEKESQAGSTFSAEPDKGLSLQPWDHDWAEIKSPLLNQLSHPHDPRQADLKLYGNFKGQEYPEHSLKNKVRVLAVRNMDWL